MAQAASKSENPLIYQTMSKIWSTWSKIIFRNSNFSDPLVSGTRLSTFLLFLAWLIPLQQIENRRRMSVRRLGQISLNLWPWASEIPDFLFFWLYIFLGRSSFLLVNMSHTIKACAANLGKLPLPKRYQKSLCACSWIENIWSTFPSFFSWNTLKVGYNSAPK